jgi:hypothetical protein
MKDKFQLSMKEMEENESKIDYETGEVIEDEDRAYDEWEDNVAMDYEC